MWRHININVLFSEQLKAIVIDDNLQILHHINVNFDEELGEYKTSGGVCRYDDEPDLVNAPVNMWLKALDLCLDKLKIEGLDFSSIVSLSGCAQQHGSVWWRRNSDDLLKSITSDQYLHKALVSAFTLHHSPVWMDSDTTDECKKIERIVGGSEELAEITGSRAYERFTGPQIAKIFNKRREVYNVTGRITLISNFLASLFIGSYAPFDASDASGMNMMDLRTKRWSDPCLKAIVGGDQAEVIGLRTRLGCSNGNDNIIDTNKSIGTLSAYFVDRYGFSANCLVGSFTGDNPGSFAGLSLARDEIFVSLGTSDTSCFWLDEPTPKINGHILRNPIDPSRYMGLICYKNASLTRERVRDQCASGDWSEFSRLLNSVPRGNFGNIGFYFDLKEIHPLVQGDFRYNKLDQRVGSFSPELEIRACLESQFLRLYYHSQQLGLKMGNITRILVTGGASVNRSILQVIADIFHLPVYTIDMPNTACLGAAHLAKYIYESTLAQKDADEKSDTSFQSLVFADRLDEERGLIRIADPTPVASSDAYKMLLERFCRLELAIDINNSN